MKANPETVLLGSTLATLAGVAHGFSHELQTEGDHAAFARAAEVTRAPLRLRQVHGDRVVDADQADEGSGTDQPLAGDALVSARPGVPLAVATADCVPILLADPDAAVVAAVHAGWRGMRAHILLRTLEAMATRGADPGNTRAAIGPAVGGSCYEVGPEVRAAYDAAFDDAATLFDGRRLDLLRAARSELDRAGLSAENVSSIERCTHCGPELASHRRQGKDRGTNLSVIELRGGSTP